MQTSQSLSKVEAVALKMFEIQTDGKMSQVASAEQLEQMLGYSFQMAYRFLDSSKKYKRTYE
jgi:hypothetical protein